MIAIPNVEKPKRCAECQFEIPDKDEYPQCIILHRFVIDGDTFINCPLIKIDLVRCEECKYREKNHYCVQWGQPYLCKDKCFCSYGERRTDERTD